MDSISPVISVVCRSGSRDVRCGRDCRSLWFVGTCWAMWQTSRDLLSDVGQRRDDDMETRVSSVGGWVKAG